MLYKIAREKLSPMKGKKILEKDVEKLVGENLEQLLGLEKVCYQFSVEGKRIDILAFDREMNAPVIIELKKDNSSGLFDQGMEYFHLLSNRKADFLLRINEVLRIPAQLAAVDWSSSKVIFIGRNFDQRQRRAVDFKGVPIELYDYDWYEDGFFKLESVGLEKRASLEIQGIGKSGKDIESVKKSFKEYSVDEKFPEGWESSKELFEELRERIFKMNSDIEEKATKAYIAYKIGKHVIFALTPRQSKLRVELYRVKEKDIEDPKNKLVYQQNSMKFYNKHISEFFIESENEIDYAMLLIRQVYEKYFLNN